jgi:hypothetical protein
MREALVLPAKLEGRARTSVMMANLRCYAVRDPTIKHRSRVAQDAVKRWLIGLGNRAGVDALAAHMVSSLAIRSLTLIQDRFTISVRRFECCAHTPLYGATS